MARILVVDDSDTDRLIVSEILSDEPDLEFEGVDGGETALARLASDPAGMVLTDLVMPVMDGFEVVAAVRERFPSVPIVLMTSQGNEEIAVRALREGAASYVPKHNLATDLVDTVREVLDLASERRAQARIIRALEKSDLRFCLENRDELVRPLVKHLMDVMETMGLCDECDATQIGVALCEALNNAIEHGNLEVQSDLRGTDLAAYDKLMGERRDCSPWCDRRVRVQARLDREEARFVIRDEGPGFDPGTLPDPRAPENLGRFHGRGVFLIRSFMDEVSWNEQGNEVTMVKRWTGD